MSATNGKADSNDVVLAQLEPEQQKKIPEEEKEEEPKVDLPPEETKEEKKEVDTEEKIEESLTPPLLPNMKIKIQSSQSSEKKKEEKDNKTKKNQWDMFAEQDTFKEDTEVGTLKDTR